MTNDGKKRKGTFRSVIDAIMAWDNAMDYTPYDYVLDRRLQSRTQSLVAERRTESVTHAQ